MAIETTISVNLEICSRCGICAEVCPSGIIRVSEAGPEMSAPKACIRCGHCVAVCPHGAMDNSRNPLATQPAVIRFPVLTEEDAEQFLRSRRSIRAYKPEPVSRKKLSKLMNIARFAQTGGNSQGISYLVISGADQMKQITETVIDWLEEQVRKEVDWSMRYAGMAKIYRQTGYDVVLRSAPHLIIALASAKNPMGRDNARFALTYAELFAPAIGLGSCWAGFFEMAALSGYEPLLALLGIPEGKNVVSAIMVGEPKYRYYRLADRNPLDVVWR